jgi:hypothetical protein
VSMSFFLSPVKRPLMTFKSSSRLMFFFLLSLENKPFTL